MGYWIGWCGVAFGLLVPITQLIKIIKTHKVKWWLLKKNEVNPFLLFLKSEKIRHQEDIDEISHLVCMVKHWYELK